MKIGQRVTTNQSDKMCRFLWNQQGTVTGLDVDSVDGQMVRVEFDVPVPSTAESWPAMKSCRMPIACISGEEDWPQGYTI